MLHQGVFSGCNLKIVPVRGLLVHTSNIKGKNEHKVHQNKAAEVGHKCVLAVMIYQS